MLNLKKNWSRGYNVVVRYMLFGFKKIVSDFRIFRVNCYKKLSFSLCVVLVVVVLRCDFFRVIFLRI